MPQAAERMSRVDTAWLHMDSEANLMMIVGVLRLASRIDHAALCRRVEERLLRYRRFRQKVVEDGSGASWVDDAAFDLQWHVVRETLPAKRARQPERVLQDRIAALAAEPLDPAHSLWRLHLVEDHLGGSVLIVRVHHCIADGIALISVMLSITDGGRAPPKRRRKGLDEDAWIADAMCKPLAGLASRAADGKGQDADGSSASTAGPPSAPGLAGGGLQIAGDALALAMMPDDAPTRLKGKPGRAKRVAWGEPAAIDDVAAIGKALDCSINDVLLACVAGAIGGYLRAKGDDTSGQEIRALVPVNLRPADEAHALGNRFGLVPLLLPIGIANPVERVHAVCGRMAALKGGFQPLLAFGLLALAGLLIKPAQQALLDLFARKATAVITNVPGPREPLSLCGARLEQVMYWVPQAGDIGVGISLLSYGGGVQFGLLTDRKLCPDPEKIIERFAPEFETLLLAAMMLPWSAGKKPRRDDAKNESARR